MHANVWMFLCVCAIVHCVREMRSSWQGWAEWCGKPLLCTLSLQWLGSHLFFTPRFGAAGPHWNELSLPNPALLTWHVYGSAAGWRGWRGISQWGQFISQSYRQTHTLTTLAWVHAHLHMYAFAHLHAQTPQVSSAFSAHALMCSCSITNTRYAHTVHSNLFMWTLNSLFFHS